MTLADAEIGDIFEVVKCEDEKQFRSKLLALGFVRGTVVELVSTAVGGDPVIVKTRGYFLSLRKEEADCVKVRPRSD